MAISIANWCNGALVKCCGSYDSPFTAGGPLKRGSATRVCLLTLARNNRGCPTSRALREVGCRAADTIRSPHCFPSRHRKFIEDHSVGRQLLRLANRVRAIYSFAYFPARMPLDGEAQLFAQEGTIVRDKNMFRHDVETSASAEEFSDTQGRGVSGKQGMSDSSISAIVHSDPLYGQSRLARRQPDSRRDGGATKAAGAPCCREAKGGGCFHVSPLTYRVTIELGSVLAASRSLTKFL
jgi:hypothetical protein